MTTPTDDWSGRNQWRVGELSVAEVGVEAAGGDELVVGAAFDNPAGVDDGDLVGRPHGGQAVGDDDRRALGEGGRQGGLDGGLRAGVEVGGGLVEDHDAGVLEQQAGESDALLLAARHAVAAVADDRVEAFGHPGHDVPDLGRPQGCLELDVGGVGAGVGQVDPQGVVEQMDVLGDDADGVPHVGERRVAQVDATDAHRAVGRVVEPGHQPGDRRLAGA